MSYSRYLLVGFLSISVISTSFAATTPEPQFSYHAFASCSELESTMRDILPTTYSDGRMYKGGGIMMMAEDARSPAPTVSVSKSLDTTPKSDTNIQVKGIDEADTVKTDGKYVYSYQEGEHAIIILDAKTLAKIKTIRVPTNYSNPLFYITKNKLILTATKYSQTNIYWKGWYNNSQKSIIALYDISNPARASLVRSIEVDGSLSDTRLGDTGIMTAVVATSYWMPQIYRPYFLDTTGKMARPTFDYSSTNLIPRISDMSYSTGKQTISTRGVADCSGMRSILPDPWTLKNYNLNPTLTQILRFDTTIPASLITSEIVLSDAGQIHVTRDSVYLTSSMWSPRGTSTCPPNAKCAASLVYNPGTSNTLVHRFVVTNATIRYSYSKLVSGSSLNQYSMDENAAGDFRIVTTNSSWSGGVNTSSTSLSVLSSTGRVIGKLSDIAPGENFQSSRFIGDRLYLVTFQQIDPLFVISLTDSRKPTILGELKMPGYSTYLHPYDANRLIGIGYDTQVNQWGSTQNGGVKIDLYDVSDIAHPKQERSLVIGDIGSSSYALWNPKQFVWYREKNLLLLPVTLMTSANDKTNTYLSKAAFQGLVGIQITPDQIAEKFRITHISPPANLATIWQKECEQYKINKTGYEQYIPDYCKIGATLDMYLANTIWNYSSDFISRVLYVGESLYTIGTSRIQMQSFATPHTQIATQKFKIQSYNFPMPIDIMPISTMVR
ncbi:beta-propeller domain-containing protein [Candidatus Gracilibacteria bacterium]|nr:beta-propeller domain-containing protein [Candidatus Gracilibacteria bacterium]